MIDVQFYNFIEEDDCQTCKLIEEFKNFYGKVEILSKQAIKFEQTTTELNIVGAPVNKALIRTVDIKTTSNSLIHIKSMVKIILWIKQIFVFF